MKKFASIDIGTNTILMTIAKGNSKDDFEVIDDVHSIARLGEGVGKSGVILPEAVQRASIILRNYKQLIDRHQVDKVLAVSTSAMREAKNNLEIIKQFESIIDGEVKIIDGEEEAELSYLGTIENPHESALIDIGGGSTEIIIGNNYKTNYRVSKNLGAVRLTEKYFEGIPPNKKELELFINYVNSELSNAPYGDFSGKVYAVAGTATTLGAIDLNLKTFDRESIHNHRLYLHRIDAIVNELTSCSTADIVLKYNIPQKRADVMPAGALILRQIMKSMNCNEIIISCLGLLYGVLKKMFENC